VSKALALGMWEEGQPKFSWVVFERLICSTCRKLFEKKYLNDTLRKKCDELFGTCQLLLFDMTMFLDCLDWLYDFDVVHTPTTLTQSSRGQDLDLYADELTCSPESSRKKVLEQALRDTGYDDRMKMTSSFAAMQSDSQMNFLRQMDKIIEHVVQIFAPDDHKTVHFALTERSIKRMQNKIKVKFG
jgi:hypothetical protein